MSKFADDLKGAMAEAIAHATAENPIPDSELLAIEARARAATPGEWEVYAAHNLATPRLSAKREYTRRTIRRSVGISPEDMEFIAHAGGDNGDVLRLVAEVRRLRKELEAKNA